MLKDKHLEEDSLILFMKNKYIISHLRKTTTFYVLIYFL